MNEMSNGHHKLLVGSTVFLDNPHDRSLTGQSTSDESQTVMGAAT